MTNQDSKQQLDLTTRGQAKDHVSKAMREGRVVTREMQIHRVRSNALAAAVGLIVTATLIALYIYTSSR